MEIFSQLFVDTVGIMAWSGKKIFLSCTFCNNIVKCSQEGNGYDKGQSEGI